MEKLNFWYSPKQSEFRSDPAMDPAGCKIVQRRMFVMIDGKRVEYTECREDDSKPAWDDARFLGRASTGDICK